MIACGSAGSPTVMITNGPGGHPSWKHAEQTAKNLIIDPFPENDPSGEKTAAAAELRRKVIRLLESYHDEFRDGIDGSLERFVEHVAQQVTALTKATVLETHFARLSVQAALRLQLAREFRTQLLIQRSWSTLI